MALPTITTLPTAPSRSDLPADFNTKADAFLNALPTFQSELNNWSAQLPATVVGADYSATSTTSLAVGTGSKTLTIAAGKNFTIGQSVRIANTATPANYMDGQVTSYSSTTLIVNVTAIGGTGTFTAWTVSLSPGAGSYASLTGTETLTNKTLTTPVLSGTASGTTAGRIGYLSGVFTGGDGTNQLTFVTTTSTQTLTNKTINFAAGGNVAQVNGNTLTASSGSATLTLPNSTDTLVGRATTDTLTNKTLTAPAINGATLDAATVVSDTGTIATNAVGFRGLPVATKSAVYTLALTDNGKTISITTGGIVIPANGSVAFPIGAAVVLFNNSASTQTVSITTDTLRQAGTANTGTRTLAAYGVATVVKVDTTTWVISGNVS